MDILRAVCGMLKTNLIYVILLTYNLPDTQPILIIMCSVYTYFFKKGYSQGCVFLTQFSGLLLSQTPLCHAGTAFDM